MASIEATLVSVSRVSAGISPDAIRWASTAVACS
jgi:hypothetical protein